MKTVVSRIFQILGLVLGIFVISAGKVKAGADIMIIFGIVSVLLIAWETYEELKE